MMKIILLSTVFAFSHTHCLMMGQVPQLHEVTVGDEWNHDTSDREIKTRSDYRSRPKLSFTYGQIDDDKVRLQTNQYGMST